MVEEREMAAGLFGSLLLEQSIYTQIGTDFAKAIEGSAESGIKIDSSLPAGAILCSIREAFEKHNALAKAETKLEALNLMMFNSGTFLYVPKNSRAEISREIISRGSGFTRTIIMADSGSEIVFHDRLLSEAGNFFHSDSLDIFAGDGASVSYSIIQDLSEEAELFSHRKAVAGQNSRISWNILNVGSKLSKSFRKTMLNAQGSSVKDIELMLTKNSQHFDTSITAEHNSPNTESRILVKGVADNKSRQVGYGMVAIAKEARDSNSFLEEHSILLGKEAKADSIPALEILTNDVMAKHAATCAQIDDEKLFYLMARGLSMEEARKLIIEGFIGSAISMMPQTHEISERAAKWLS